MTELKNNLVSSWYILVSNEPFSFEIGKAMQCIDNSLCFHFFLNSKFGKQYSIFKIQSIKLYLSFWGECDCLGKYIRIINNFIWCNITCNYRYVFFLKYILLHIIVLFWRKIMIFFLFILKNDHTVYLLRSMVNFSQLNDIFPFILPDSFSFRWNYNFLWMSVKTLYCKVRVCYPIDQNYKF